MDPTTTEIHRFRQRVALRVAGIRALRWGAVYLLVWGSVALVLRAAFGTTPGALLWGLSGLLAVGVPAWRAGLQARPESAAVRARLDRDSAAGGLLMAADEIHLGAWRERLAVPPRLVVAARAGRGGWAALGAAVYLGACLLIPVSRAGEAPPQPLDVRREVAELAQRLAQLEEAGLVERERAEELLEQLEEVEENAAGDRPAESWEALDELARQTEALAAEAAQEALAASDELALAGDLAQELANAAETGVDVTAAARELAALARQAAAEQGRMEEFADLLGEGNGTASDGAAGEWSPEQLRQLAEGLTSASQEELERLRRLAETGRLPPGVDGELLRQAARQAAERAAADDALLAFLEENAGSSLSEALGQCRAGGSCNRPGAPGQGGVTRGPGPAPMTWKDPSAEDGARFEEVALPPSALAALGPQSLLGLSAADPSRPGSTGPSGSSSGAAALPAGEGSAVVRELLPQHRGAVRRYFERTSSGEQP